MKIHRLYHLALLLPSLLSLFLQAETEMHIWDSLTGHSTRAAFVRLENHVVVLRGNGGEEMRVPLQLLTPASRDRARTMTQVSVPDSDGAKLVHETSAYRLHVNADRVWGKLWLKRPDGSLFPHEPIQLVHYIGGVKGKKAPDAVNVQGIKTPPKLKDKTIRWSLSLEHNAVLHCELKLEPDSIGMGYSLEKGSLDSFDSINDSVQMNFPKILEWDLGQQAYMGTAATEGIPKDELEERLEEKSLTLHPNKGNRSTHLFSSSMPKSYIGDLEEVDILGMYDPIKLEISAGDSASLSLYIYGSQPPYNGFRLSMGKSEYDSSADSAHLTLKFRR